MLILTDSALRMLDAALERTGAGDSRAIRIVPGDKGWVMRVDEPRADDETFDYRGRTVLVLDADVAERLEDNTLDVVKTAGRRKLKLRQVR